VPPILFQDLVPIPELQALLDSLYQATAIPAFVLAPDGTILVGSGWQDACAQFHRKCPATEARCRESDAYISQHIHEGPFVGYRCKNGLMDYACPMLLEGQHVATLFTGQIFLEPPDEPFFRAQAREFGLDEAAYLNAIRRVPVIAKERVPFILEFVAELAKSMAATGLARLRERAATQQAIDLAEERFRVAVESISDVVYEWDLADRVDWFGNVDALMGYEPGEFPRSLSGWGEALHPDDRALVMAAIDRHLRGEAPYSLEYRVKRKDGSFSRWAARGRVVREENGKAVRWIGTITDVTELRRGELELRASETRLRTTLSSIGDAVISTDSHGRVELLNPVAEALTGWPAAAAKGRPATEVFRIVNEETRATVASPVERVLREGTVIGLANHTVLIDRSGAERPIADSGAPIRDEKGEVTGVVLVFRDQTEERAAQKALRETTSYLENLIGYANAPIIVWDRQFLISRFNRAFESLTGRKAGEVIGRSLEVLFPSEKVKSSMELIKNTLTGERWEAVEIDIRHVDGSVRTVLWNSATILASDGKTPLATIAQGQDITERKQAEAELHESERRYRTLADSLPHLVWTCQADGPCDYLSPRWVEYTGVSEADQLGYGWLQQLHPDDRERVIAEWSAVAPRGGLFDIEFRIRRADGVYRWFKTRAIPFCDNDGQVVKWFGSNTDIDDSKRAEAEIRLLNADLEQRVAVRTQQLEESNKELEAFSYSVSHDLRAPLRAIDGFARILTDDYGPKLDDEAKRVCSIIRENTGRMGRLIDDLLAFSRLGRAQMQPSSIDMGGMARAVFQEVTTPERRVHIDFQVEPMPSAVGDPSLMRQVWMNLLGNAVKFSSKRERVVVRVSGETKDGESIYSVRDNGAGFDMRYVQKLFGVFQRLHSSKEFEGTGVGLALVQRVIRRHGGRVWAEGETDRGATFFFALPQKGT
jgi:PAS domain S-box-containing protein